MKALFAILLATSAFLAPAGAQTTQCENTSRTGNCATWFNGLTCAASALSGAASFCSPAGYPGFGGWLKGVGGPYCAT